MLHVRKTKLRCSATGLKSIQIVISATGDRTESGLRANSRGDSQSGWTAGVGAEWAFAPNWSARLEYNYMNFGNDTPNFCIGGACARVVDIDQDAHVFTVGVNFRFR